MKVRLYKVLLISVITACVCLNVSAQQKSLDQKLTLSIQNLTLIEVLNQISEQTGISFSYNPKKIPGNSKINYKCVDKKLSEVLEDISKSAGIEFQLVENQIIIKEAKKKDKIEEQTATFSGYIKDKNTGEPLIGAALIISELKTGVVTNAFGFFSITLPKNNYEVNYSFVGYSRQTEQINLTSSFTKDVTLTEVPPLLEEILVTDEQEEETVQEVQASKMELRPTTVQQRPSLFGEVDVIKSLESVPGIKLHSDGSTYYSVRGGSQDQNVVMIDDAFIYNPSHLLGLFSTVIPDAVNDITLYKGDMPASLGGRISSLLDIRTRKGNDQRSQVWGNVGLISTKLGLEGPLKKDASSFLISARLSQLKWFFKLDNPNIKKFQFYDFTAKTNFRLNTRNRIYFSFYTGSDNFFTGNNGIAWSNTAGSFRWNHIFNDRLFMNTTLSASGYDYNLYTDWAHNTRWNSHISNGTIKTDLTYFIKPQSQIDFGLSLAGYNFNPGNFKSYSVVSTPAVSVRNSTELVAYANHELSIGKKWAINYGLRLTSWTNTGEAFEFTFDKNRNPIDTSFYKKGESYKTYVTAEPRLTLRHTLNETSSLKATASHNIQNVHLISNSISPFTSLEVWLPSSINIKPQKANQFTFGYYKSFLSKGISFQAETFYKLMSNQIDFESHAQTFLNPLLEAQLRFGKAKAYGAEFLLKKDAGRLRGWVGYTYSRSKRIFADINNGKTYNSFYDRPNQINLMLTYDLNARWNFGANWNFSTGAPYSSPVSFYSYNGEQVPIYGQKNNDRLPNYHRLDVSATVRLNKNPEQKFQHHLSLSIFNFYARKNALYVNYNKQEASDGSIAVPTDLLNGNYITSQSYLMRFVPSLTYNFKWL